MAIVFACGETTGFSSRSGVEISTPTLWHTARSRTAMGNHAYGNIVLPSDMDEGRFRFQRRAGTWTAAGAMCVWKDAGGVDIIRLYKVTNGDWNIGEWSGSAWVVRATLPYITATIHPVEIEWDIPGDILRVWVDEVLELDTTFTYSHNAVHQINVTPAGGTGTPGHREGWSEIIVADNARALDSVLVETEAPNANGTDTDGTGAYTDVDELANDATTTAIEFSTAGQRKSFTSPARTGTHGSGTILAVTVAMDLRYVAGGPEKARFFLKIGGTRYYGPTFTLTLGYSGYQHAWSLNPATSAAWTSTDADSSGLEWGVEAVT